MTSSIARICAWCGCGLGEDPGAEKERAAEGAPVTHGICYPCMEAMGFEEPGRWKPCGECDGQGHFLTYVGEEANAGMGPTRVPVEKEVRCEAPGCVCGYVKVEAGEDGYEGAWAENPNDPEGASG